MVGPVQPVQARAWLAAALLVPVAGCTAGPTVEPVVHPGDLVRAALLVWNGDGTAFPVERSGAPPPDVCTVDACPAAGDARPFVLGAAAPSDVPSRWTNATVAPSALADALVGMREGDVALLDDVLAYGERDEALVAAHPRAGGLSRFVHRQDAYDVEMAARALENGTLLLEPTDAQVGAPLGAPRWCNERFCLFRSSLVGWNETHLLVHHEPADGVRAHVQELDTYLTVRNVTDDLFVVDGNDPRAGTPYEVYARIEEVRAPPGSTQRAPDFALRTLEGDEVSLGQLLGRPVVLEFFASWCPSCVKNIEHLKRLQEEHGDHVAILSVSIDPWEDERGLAAWGERYGVTWPMAIDRTGELARDFRVGALSTEMVLTPEGAIAHVETGVADHEAVSELVGRLAGHPPGARS